MDPAMGIVGAILITRWSWGLLKATSRVLLDQQQTGIQQGVKRAFSYHRLLYVIVGHKTSRNRVILGSKPERPTNDLFVDIRKEITRSNIEPAVMAYSEYSKSSPLLNLIFPRCFLLVVSVQSHRLEHWYSDLRSRRGCLLACLEMSQALQVVEPAQALIPLSTRYSLPLKVQFSVARQCGWLSYILVSNHFLSDSALPLRLGRHRQ